MVSFNQNLQGFPQTRMDLPKSFVPLSLIILAVHGKSFSKSKHYLIETGNKLGQAQVKLLGVKVGGCV